MVQSRCYSLLETCHNYTHERFVSASLRFFALVNLWGHIRIEIPYPALFPLRIPHSNAIKRQNPAPTRNCNSRFPPLFSAQIPNITAKKKPNPASRQTYRGPSFYTWVTWQQSLPHCPFSNNRAWNYLIVKVVIYFVTTLENEYKSYLSIVTCALVILVQSNVACSS